MVSDFPVALSGVPPTGPTLKDLNSLPLTGLGIAVLPLLWTLIRTSSGAPA